ncbi:glycosyltransferase [Patescibacteria group bacterium]|nr:glycosyltransferase [Patescibacteria group bacterium]
MKILLVVHDFWPNFKAGTENATYYLAKELSKRHEVYVFTAEPNSESYGFEEIYDESGFKVIRIHQRKSSFRSIKDTYQNAKLNSVFREYLSKVNPDVVHVQHLVGLSIDFIKIAKNRNVPVLYTLHDFWFECPLIRKYYKNNICHDCGSSKCNECLITSFPLTSSSSFIAAALKKMLKTRYVKRITYTLLSGFNLSYLVQGGQRRSLLRERNKSFMEAFELVDVFISPSQFLADEVKKFGISKSIKVVSHGLSIPSEKLLKDFFERKEKKNNEVRFCFMSHLAREKGIKELIDSFLKLKLKYSNVFLDIYGSYNENDRYSKTVLEKLEGTEGIKYHGVFSNESISRVLQNVDVVVVPSLWEEIYCLVVDEAYLHKIPVIVSNRGGMAERVKKGKGGYIFDPDVKDDLFDKMSLFADDPNHARKLSKSIPEIKSIDKYSEEIEKIYFKCLEKNEVAYKK